MLTVISMGSLRSDSGEPFTDCGEYLISRDVAHAVVVVGVVGFANAGCNTIDAREWRLECDIAGAERPPFVDVLRAEKRDNGQADRGGEMHGAAVVTEEEIKTLEESGKPGDRNLFGDDGGGCYHE